MKIKGANLGEIEADLKGLSDYTWDVNSNVLEIIKKVENLYLNVKNKVSEESINPILVDDDENVILSEHAVNHRCSKSMETLKTISTNGLLASEWFGQLESEYEARFCTFISRLKGKDYPYVGSLSEDDYSRLNIGNNILLFFDDSNPLFKYLLHLDYFEFEYQKKNNPNYKDLYSKDELEILEKLIEPLSPGGKDMRKNYDFNTNYWSAIPGGIPSEFINGICVKNNNYSNEELDEISSLFPNAVIFNASKKVIKYPKINNNQHKL